MKKRLLSVALIGAAGCAFAQSSVTLYGRVDTSVGSETLNNVRTSNVYSGQLTPGRFGFRGTESLSAGLKVNFVLENGFNSDDGTTGLNGTAFSRASWVGLSGGFGAVRLGLVDSPYKDIFDSGNSNIVFDSAFTPYNVAYTGVASYVSRLTNQVRYDSPSFGGVTASVGIALDETAGVSNDTTALNLRWRNGPLDVGAAIQQQKNSVLASDRDYRVFGATYDLGFARISGQYQTAEQGDGREDKEFGLGVVVPVGKMEFSAGYARGKTELGANRAKGTGFGLGATYELSKRSKVYAGFLDGKVETSTGTTTLDRRLYSVGMRHDF